jgi:hypothetical protein
VVPRTRNIARQLLGTTLKYLSFETHAIQLDPADNTRIVTMWLPLENYQLASPEAPPIYQPAMNWTWFFQEHFPGRYTGLPYFPPDPNIDIRQLQDFGIDPAIVPQRCALWFKLRGEATGSQFPTLIGEWVPEPGSEKAKTFSSDKSKSFVGWQLINVQMGKLRECVQLLAYLAAHPLISFAESGSCIHPEHPTWSASPDGKVTDIGPFEFPDSTLLEYSMLDRTQGVVEFKASRNNFDMTATHVEQCVWEMFCCNVMWCDLVRYSEQWERDERNVFRPATKCKVIRIVRNMQTFVIHKICELLIYPL